MSFLPEESSAATGATPAIPPASRPGSEPTGAAAVASGGVTFLHTADWQLGMLRHFLGPEAQARYAQARIDAIEQIAAHAEAIGAAFVVVAGDVFDANQVDRQVVLRACEALRAMPCRTYLLPGNHDCLEPGSVWSVPPLTRELPSHVEVLADSAARCPVPGVEVVGLPLRTRRPLHDPMATISELAPTPPEVLRVVVGHGQLDALVPDTGETALIRLAGLERAVDEGRAQYIALGDRHSRTEVGGAGRIWYSGTTEPTRPEEEAPGDVLRVDLGTDAVAVTPLRVGRWRMLSEVVEVDSDEALEALAERLAEQPDKSRTVLRLGVRGALSVAGYTRLEMLLEAQEEVYAAIQRWRRHWDVDLRPDAADLASLERFEPGGPARGAAEELRQSLAGGDTEAADALALLHRLASA